MVDTNTRAQILARVGEGDSVSAVARDFKVSPSTVLNWLKKTKKNKKSAPKVEVTTFVRSTSDFDMVEIRTPSGHFIKCNILNLRRVLEVLK